MIAGGDIVFPFSPCAAVVRQTVPRRTPLYYLRIVERFFYFRARFHRAWYFGFFVFRVAFRSVGGLK